MTMRGWRVWHLRARTSFFVGLFLCVCFLCAQDDPLRKKAEAGDPAAEFSLANEYFYGTKTRRVNPTLAAHWFRKVADRDIPEGQFNYAVCLDRGIGVERDPLAAFEYYKKAAESGLEPARYNYALTLLHGVDIRSLKVKPLRVPARQPELALEILRSLEKKDFVPARVELAAEKIRAKDASPAEQREAFQTLQSCVAKRGAPAKLYRVLADCYYQGIGTEPDPKKMIANLKKAASMGDIEAIAKLAHCYEYGINTDPNPVESFRLYKHAALAGVPLAQYKYGELIADGREPGLGLASAMEWFQRSADNFCPQAMIRLGDFAAEGVGARQDLKRAAEYYLAAAKLDYPQGAYKLAPLFLLENGPLPLDREAAFYWFKRAAAQNYAPAQRRLAICYFDGLGCEKDHKKGLEMLALAASNGDEAAFTMLERLKSEP